MDQAVRPVARPTGPTVGRGWMLLCALVGLVLLALGAWALPPRTAEVRALERVPTRVPTQQAPGASLSSGPGGVPPIIAASAAASPRSPTSSASGRARTGALAGATLVPRTGPGTYDKASVSVPTAASRGRLYRFDVRVEKGLDLDPDAVAEALERTLDDPRSWRSTGRARFSLVPTGEQADLHAYLVTPGTTDRLCAPLLTRGEVSCRSGNKVVLNAKRWVLGADAYGDDVAGYRDYLANHEFGHALGHGHVGCPREGRPAPVMLQQTKGLQGCTANPWPSVTRG